MARPRGNRWQADVEVDGKRVRKSFKTEAQAVAFEEAHKSGGSSSGVITLGPYADEQFDAIWGDTKAPETSQININTLRRYLGEDTLLVDIDERRIDRLVADMRKQNVKNATINRKLSTLSRLLRQAERHKIIPKRPHIEFLAEDGGRDRVLTKDEERRATTFFEHAGQALTGALFNFLLYTGCRLGEAFKVTRDDVRDGYVLFSDRKSKARNGTNTMVPLVGPAKEAWDAACRLSNHFRPFGDALPRKTFYGHWNLLKTHLGADDEEAFVPHMLRHTCCTRLVTGGVPLTKVMKWMGHKNIQTTMRYSHLIPKDLDDAAAALLKA